MALDEMRFKRRLVECLATMGAVLAAGGADAQAFTFCRGPLNGGLPGQGVCSSTEAYITEDGHYVPGSPVDDKTFVSGQEAISEAVLAFPPPDTTFRANAYATTSIGSNFAAASTNFYNARLGIIPRAYADSDWGDTIVVSGPASTSPVPITIEGELHAVYTIPSTPGFNPTSVNSVSFLFGVDGVTRIDASSLGLAPGSFQYIRDGHTQILNLPGGPTYTVDIPWTLTVLVGTTHTFSLESGLTVLAGYGGLVDDPDTVTPGTATIDGFTAPDGYGLTSSLGQLYGSDGSYSYAPPVPEPGTAVLMLLGMTAMGFFLRQRRSA